jgi:hypothetical protein
MPNIDSSMACSTRTGGTSLLHAFMLLTVMASTWASYQNAGHIPAVLPQGLQHRVVSQSLSLCSCPNAFHFAAAMLGYTTSTHMI